jgi:hypothetical protein
MPPHFTVLCAFAIVAIVPTANRAAAAAAVRVPLVHLSLPDVFVGRRYGKPHMQIMKDTNVAGKSGLGEGT